MIACVSVSACTNSGTSRSAPTGAGFDNQNAKPITCLAHQTKPPDRRYTAGQDADTAHILLMLQYYTANGSKPFCAGSQPSKTDLKWVQLYIDLGGQSIHVARILHAVPTTK